MNKILLLASLAIVSAVAIAQDYVVTSKAPGSITVVETVKRERTISIDVLISEKAALVETGELERRNRAAFLIAKDKEITEAQKLGIQPSAELAAILEDINERGEVLKQGVREAPEKK